MGWISGDETAPRREMRSQDDSKNTYTSTARGPSRWTSAEPTVQRDALSRRAQLVANGIQPHGDGM